MRDIRYNVYPFLMIEELIKLENMFNLIKKEEPLSKIIESIFKNSVEYVYFDQHNLKIYKWIEYEIYKDAIVVIYESINNKNRHVQKLKKMFISFHNAYSFINGWSIGFHRIKKSDINTDILNISIKIKNKSKWWDIYHTLKIGDKIDAMDSWGIWYEAVVIDKHVKNGIYVKYKGWNETWNEWYQYDKRFNIAPLNTFTPFWKKEIKKQEVIEYKDDNNMWYETICIDKKGDSIVLQRVNDNKIIIIDDIYKNDNICPIGIHIIWVNTICNPKNRYWFKYSIRNLSLFAKKKGKETIYIKINLIDRRIRITDKDI